MRALRLAAICAAVLLAVPGTALASEHLMTVSEVNWAFDGHTAQQYVELFDPFAEPFPNQPNYKLVLYDSTGAVTGQTSIPHPFGAMPLLIANDVVDSAPGFPARDIALTFTLPTTAGQLCFNNGTIDIQCLNWGTITAPRTPESGTKTFTSAVPTDGTSVQRRRDGSLEVATANPKAENVDSPQVSTGAASALSTTGATLNGTVDPAQQSTAYTFEYGKTTAYGTTVTGNVPAGGASVAVANAIAGLEPGTTYHYRLKASNHSGDATGTDRTFATSAEGGATGPTGPSGQPGQPGASGTSGTNGPNGAGPAGPAKPDRTKPKVTLTAARTAKLAKVLSGGYKGAVRIDEPGTVTLQLKRGKRVLGTAKLTFTRATRRAFTVRLRSSAKTALKALTAEHITITLRVLATDKAKNTRIVTKTLTLTSAPS